MALFFIGCGGEEEQMPVRQGTPNPRYQPFTRGEMKTPYGSEAEFIVHETLLDLCEMAWFASKRAPARSNDLQLTVNLMATSPREGPRFTIQLKVGGQSIQSTLTLTQAWRVDTFLPLAHQVTGALKLDGPPPKAQGDPNAEGWLAKALETRSTALEEWNQTLSKELEGSPQNIELHRSAAVLLGILMLRENAGSFSETRTELCRLVAHLTFARALSREPTSSMGELAEVMLSMAIGAQTEAIARLDGLQAPSQIQGRWHRLLRAGVTSDYRMLEAQRNDSPEETRMWAKTRSESLRPDLTWSKLPERTASENTHLLRIARNAASSVQIMHSPANEAIPSELAEFNEVRRLGRGTPITNAEISRMLNVAPERLVGADGHLRIISHGTWAMHFQRHLCNAIQRKLRFYAVSLGLQDTTEQGEELSTAYGSLWLAPLIKLYDSHGLENPFLGRKTEAPLRDLILERPSLIPSACWTSLKVSDIRGPSVLEVRLESTLRRWTEFSPPPATAYNLLAAPPTLPNLSTQERLAVLKELRRIAPYSQSICSELLKATASTNRPVAEFLATWGILTNYNLEAMLQSAGCFGPTPALYEARLTEIAAIDPWEYVTLGDYVTRCGETNRGMELLQKGLTLTEDRVAAASRASTLVRYHQRNGRDAEARRIAEEAAGTYSSRGLSTMEEYHEFRGELSEAMTWAKRNDERYQTLALFRLCLRNYEKTQDPDLVSYMLKQIIRYRDKSAREISRLDRSHPPITGVRVMSTNENTARYGIGISNVIVGLDGFQVGGTESYTTLRIASGKTNLSLVCWDGTHYKDIEIKLPGGRLGAAIRDYVYHSPNR